WTVDSHSPCHLKFLTSQHFSPVELALNINIPKSLPVRMSMPPIDVKSKVTGRMRINGPPESPLLTWHIVVERGSLVKFNTNTFEVQSGILDWENVEPT